uniref:Testis expressed 9 n=1 Tax=Ornithorhynchus anatinus TaxID=9258 RepID=A0A6I8PE99_ORNAN
MAARPGEPRVAPAAGEETGRAGGIGPGRGASGCSTRFVPLQRQRPPGASSPHALTGDLLAKEEEYKRLNAELDAKTLELVHQADRVIKEQQEILSRAISSQIQLTTEEDDNLRELQSSGGSILPTSNAKQTKNKKQGPEATLQNKLQSRNVSKNEPSSAELQTADDVAILEDVTDFSLAKTFSNLEGTLDGGGLSNNVDDIFSGAGKDIGSEAQIRLLKAKLRVTQEELDTVVRECNKKEDVTRTLMAHVKELEEERAKLQQTVSAQQSQMEKYKALMDEARKKRDEFEQQLAAMEKELEHLKKVQKQASSSQNATEVRLNRALEDAGKHKQELEKLKQTTKDANLQENKQVELLKEEKRILEKEKGELVSVFKKQQKLIDVLKRQKVSYVRLDRIPGNPYFTLILR